MKGSRTGVKVVDEPIQVDVQYIFDYIEMPTVFRLQIKEFKRFGLFTATGFALSILIHRKYQLDGTVGFNDGGTWRVEPISEESDMPNTDMFDFSLLFGGGITYQLRSKRLFLEYRFTIGWNSIPVPTYETEDPVGMRNQAYSLMLGIEL
jgi:hypothetical protein